jgi:glycosyltransferase involved in cell wall biosynthesis
MKILFCIHAPKNGNTAVYGAYLSRKSFCEDKGWQADTLTPQDFPEAHLTGRRIYLFYALHLMLKLIKGKESYDIIIFHSFCGWAFNLAKWFFPRFRRTAVITTFHGLEALFIEEMIAEHRRIGRPTHWYFNLFHGNLLNSLIWISCRLSDNVFCLNRREYKYLAEHHYQSPENIMLIANEISEKFYSRRSYALQAKSLLFVGQWLITKGTRYLIEAFNILAQEDSELHLTIAGTLTGEEEVLKDIPKHLHSRIRVFTQIDHEKLFRHYEEADLFIFPSLSEGFARALIEAMITGLPAISTQAGSAADFLVHSQNAWVVPYRDPQAIAAAVRALKKDPKLRESLGKTGQKDVLENFTRTKVLEDWSQKCLNCYRKK